MTITQAVVGELYVVTDPRGISTTNCGFLWCINQGTIIDCPRASKQKALFRVKGSPQGCYFPTSNYSGRIKLHKAKEGEISFPEHDSKSEELEDRIPTNERINLKKYK